MTLSPSPLAVGLIAAGLAAVVIFVSILAVRAARNRNRSRELKLPQGADAALWSIVEVVPDPRNHLALTRDLSGEVRITDLDRAIAAAATPAALPATSPVIDAKPVIELHEWTTQSDSRDNLELTAQLFFAEEPRLSRF